MIGALTLFESARLLAKRWELRDGQPFKTTAAQMTSGTFEVLRFSNVRELKGVVEAVTTHQALCASLPRDGSLSGRVVTARALVESPGAIARTKQHFPLAPQPGLLFLDADQDGITREELWHMLREAVPALGSAGVLWRPSGSSHIFHGNDDLTGLRGQHLLVLTADASDGPRIIKTIADRLWLAGHGHIRVSSAGSLLVRGPIDTAPADAARLIFVGGAECVAPLDQRRGPAVILSNGGFLDPRNVPDLTPAERARVEALIEQAKAAKQGEADQRKAEHRKETITRRLPSLMKVGLTASEAEQRIGSAVDAAFGGVLIGDFELTLVHDDGQHEVVNVAHVLANRDRYHESDCLDPLHPAHRSWSADARLYLHGTSPIVYSLDDGGRVYRLRSQQRRITVARGNRAELVAQLAEVVANLDCVFLADTGPVHIDRGQRWPLTVERLMNLIGREVVLVVKNKNGEAPMDLQREVAALVLAALPHTGGVWRNAA